MNLHAPEYKPSKRAAALLHRQSLPWDDCVDCVSKRNDAMERLRMLRVDLAEKFALAKGKDIGMTVGLMCRDIGPMWVDIVVLSGIVFN